MQLNNGSGYIDIQRNICWDAIIFENLHAVFAWICFLFGQIIIGLTWTSREAFSHYMDNAWMEYLRGWMVYVFLGAAIAYFICFSYYMDNAWIQYLHGSISAIEI